MSTVAFLSFLVLLLAIGTQAGPTFDVLKYGAKANGEADDTTAFLAAWKEACAATEPSVMLVGKGDYVVSNVLFSGPCKAPVTFMLEGRLMAPSDPNKMNRKDAWIGFHRNDRLTVTGSGTFDGRGSQAWHLKDRTSGGKVELPNGVGLFQLTNSRFSDVTSKDSKFFHITVLSCNNLTMENIKIEAPHDSPNTDGIHLGRSNGVNITGAVIKTGDDCISFGDGMENVHIQNVECGPGHGISIGSLGRSEKEAPLNGIYVKNCTISGTSNGVRIKTWPGPPAYPTVVNGIHFEDIQMNNVTFPIIIDQEYCAWHKCDPQANPSKVKISNVSFTNIRGTSATVEAIKLMCSKGVPCENVILSEIDLSFQGGQAKSICDNIKPTVYGKVVPAACGGAATPGQGMPPPTAGGAPIGASGSPAPAGSVAPGKPSPAAGGAPGSPAPAGSAAPGKTPPAAGGAPGNAAPAGGAAPGNPPPAGGAAAGKPQPSVVEDTLLPATDDERLGEGVPPAAYVDVPNVEENRGDDEL